ncbi:MAG: hypothetical protein GY832_43510 [Chloroflexi bacterium]|nr:hypothetical protein [Chloroflexota bacterium]
MAPFRHNGTVHLGSPIASFQHSGTVRSGSPMALFQHSGTVRSGSPIALFRLDTRVVLAAAYPWPITWYRGVLTARRSLAQPGDPWRISQS